MQISSNRAMEKGPLQDWNDFRKQSAKGESSQLGRMRTKRSEGTDQWEYAGNVERIVRVWYEWHISFLKCVVAYKTVNQTENKQIIGNFVFLIYKMFYLLLEHNCALLNCLLFWRHDHFLLEVSNKVLSLYIMYIVVLNKLHTCNNGYLKVSSNQEHSGLESFISSTSFSFVM